MKVSKIPSIREIISGINKERLDTTRRFLLTIVEFLYLWRNELVKDRCPQRAASLTYTTLLAIFPLIAVVALFVPALFGGYEEMQGSVIEFLEGMLIPTAGEKIETTMRSYFDTFRENSVGVGFFGVIGLMLSAVALFASVDKSFNAIWLARSRRSRVHLFTRFSSMLILLPIFIGGSILLTVELKSRMEIVGRFFSLMLPYIMTCTALTVAFYIIPNTRVNFFYALIGGITSGLLWEFAKVGFSFYVGAPRIGLIIKSLGVIPIFLIWIYFSWFIVLVGCELAFVLQYFHRLRLETFRKIPCVTIDHKLIFLVFLIIADNFHRNLGSISFQSLINKVPIKVNEMERIIDLLKKAHMVSETSYSEFILGRPLESLKPQEILALGCRVDNMFLKSGETDEIILQTARDLQDSVLQWARQKHVRDFFPPVNDTVGDPLREDQDIQDEVT